jgi:glutamate-5-semialdehyde dehydrogenase
MDLWSSSDTSAARQSVDRWRTGRNWQRDCQCFLETVTGSSQLPRQEYCSFQSLIPICSSCINGSIEASPLWATSQIAKLLFYEGFRSTFEDEAIFSQIREANERNVADAQANGTFNDSFGLERSMRQDMIDALLIWKLVTSSTVRETVKHDGWTLNLMLRLLVLSDLSLKGRTKRFCRCDGSARKSQCLRFQNWQRCTRNRSSNHGPSGNTEPADAGLPACICFACRQRRMLQCLGLVLRRRLSLAVARGSGSSVALLGEIAQQHGIPASLHGTGGAWMIVSDVADA